MSGKSKLVKIAVLSTVLPLLVIAGAFGARYQEMQREATVVTELHRAGIRMVPIPGGTFRMGDVNATGVVRDMYRPRKVTVSSFEMSATEITQRQFRMFRRYKMNAYAANDSMPIILMNWMDAAEFCNDMSMRFGLSKCYEEYFWTCDFSKNGFRLPTEAEWEYACRAGTSSEFYTGNSEMDLSRAGWYRGNSLEKLHPVGLKQPNAFGLYDMTGNVFEWCNDWFGIYAGPDSVKDPSGPKNGSNRVLRGGSWYNNSFACRSSYRVFGDPENRRLYVGFRVVRRR